MTLLRAELRRILHRRLTHVAIAAAVAVMTLAGVVTFSQHSAKAPDLVAANELAASESKLCFDSYASDSLGLTATQIEENCFFDPLWFVSDQRFHAKALLQNYGTVGEPWSQARTYLTSRTSFITRDGENGEAAAEGFSGSLPGIGIALVIASAVLGASYMGAEWKSGVMESQLVRQPNRKKLMAAKLSAIALVTSFLSAAVGALSVAAFLPAAHWRGDFADLDTQFWLDATLVIARTSVAAAVLAILAASVTMLARSTVAGVVATFTAFTLGGVVGAWSLPGSSAVALPQNLTAWIANGDVARYKNFASGGSYETWLVPSYSWLVAGLGLAAAAVLFASAGTWAFQRRDVA